jgi:integrase
MFTREDGAPLNPDYITRRFKELTRETGLPVIKFHGRHTAATLALEANVATKIVSEQLGHSTTRITEDQYQHVRMKVQIDAAEQTVALLPGTKPTKRTGS